MELKIQKATGSNCDNNSKNTSRNNGPGFGDILNDAIAKSNSSQTILNDSDKEKVELYKSAGIEAINNLPAKNKAAVEFAMCRIGEIFGKDPYNLDPYNYFREDSTIDFKKFVNDLGDKYISSNSLDALYEDLNTLHDNGFVTDEDYDYCSKWILSKINAEKIKLKNKEMITTTYESLGCHKKSK